MGTIRTAHPVHLEEEHLAFGALGSLDAGEQNNAIAISEFREFKETVEEHAVSGHVKICKQVHECSAGHNTGQHMANAI